MCVQIFKFVAIPIPEIKGGAQKIGQSLDTPTLLFSKIFNDFIRMDPVNVLAKIEVRGFTVPEIIGVPKKNSAVPGYAHSPFSPKVLISFCSGGPCYCSGQI